MSDTFFTTLKFISLAIGSVSGIIGLFVDFSNKRTKKITKGGYVIVGLIIFTGALALILQYKDIQDSKAKAITENKQYSKTISLMQQQLGRTDTLLKNVNRSMSPLKDMSVELDVVIFFSTLDSLVHERSYLHYRKRIEDLAAISDKRHAQGFFFKEGDPDFPDAVKEAFMNDMLSYCRLNLDVYEHADFQSLQRGAVRQGDMSLYLFFSPGEKQPGEFKSIYYDSYHDALELRLQKDIPADNVMLQGDIASLPDLAGNSMKVGLGMGGKFTNISNETLKGIFQGIYFRHLYLNSYGRKMNIQRFKPLYYDALTMNYYYRFPKNLSELTKGTSVYNQ